MTHGTGATGELFGRSFPQGTKVVLVAAIGIVAAYASTRAARHAALRREGGSSIFAAMSLMMMP